MNEVPTAKAITANSWFDTPNKGQMVSMLPVTARYPHATHTTAPTAETLSQLVVEPSGDHTCRATSWKRYRATRVPVSSAVKMNTASNMIAKWYQYAISCPMRGI